MEYVNSQSSFLCPYIFKNSAGKVISQQAGKTVVQGGNGCSKQFSHQKLALKLIHALLAPGS